MATNAGQNVGKGEHLFTDGRTENWCSYSESQSPTKDLLRL